MIHIRAPQVFALGKTDASAAIEAMLPALQQRFTRVFARLDEDDARALVETALARASDHGLTHQRDAYLFVCIWLLFGEDFDRRLPWAKRVLAGPEGGHAGRRADRLLYLARRHERDAQPTEAAR